MNKRTQTHTHAVNGRINTHKLGDYHWKQKLNTHKCQYIHVLCVSTLRVSTHTRAHTFTLNNSNSFFGIISFKVNKQNKWCDKHRWDEEQVTWVMERSDHLYGVTVDGLPTACRLHRSAHLQNVVWHISCSPRTVPHLPPLLPVIQHLITNHIIHSMCQSIT